MGNASSRKPKKQTAPSQDRIRDAFQEDSEKMKRLRVEAENVLDGMSVDDQVLDLRRFGLTDFGNFDFSEFAFVEMLLDFNRIESFPLSFNGQEMLRRLSVRNNFLIDVTQCVDGLTNLTYLDVSNNWLNNVDFVSEMVLLEFLDVSCNPITEIDVKKLDVLKILNISRCRITEFPVVGLLAQLEELNVSYNEISKVPETIGLLKAMRIFNVSNNKIKKLPSSIAKCSMLTHFYGQFTLITEMPIFEEASQLVEINVALTKVVSVESSLLPPQLQTFYCHGTEILDFPALPNIEGLTTLSLRWMKWEEIPETVWSIISLTNLDISGNKLTSIKGVGQLINLLSLNVSFNNLETLPAELQNLVSIEYIYIDRNPLSEELISLFHRPNTNGRTILAYLSDKSLEYEFVTHERELSSLDLSMIDIELGDTTSLSSEEFLDKIYGCLFGHAIGDAMGLMSEFMSPSQTSFHYGKEFIKYRDIYVDNHRRRWGFGDFTDDTDQMILIMENIVNNNGYLTIPEYAESLLRWAYEGFAELGDSGGMGIGNTVSSVLRHSEFMIDPHTASKEVWSEGNMTAAANGAVMRTSILGILDFDDREKLLQNTINICKVTHTDLRCQASCIAETVAISEMLKGNNDIEFIRSVAIESAKEFLTQEYFNQVTNEPTLAESYLEKCGNFEEYISQELKELNLGEGSSIGYTLKCIASGFWALDGSDFEKTMMKLFQEGGDADTNGAVAGALLGTKLGYKNLPKEWVESLLHYDWFKSKVDTFVNTVFAK